MNFFRKQKKEHLFLQEPFVSATLVNGSFIKISALPQGVDRSEWLAANTADFLNFTKLFYLSICEYCNPNDTMTAGQVECLWIDVFNTN
jgi:MOB kinase activator 1